MQIARRIAIDSGSRDRQSGIVFPLLFGREKRPGYPLAPQTRSSVLLQAETTGGACEERRELIAARTKLLPNSHIGPGNLRHSVKTLSSAVTNNAISFSPMMSGGRILSTSMAWPAT